MAKILGSGLIQFGARRETKANLLKRAQELGLTGYEKLKKTELKKLVDTEETRRFMEWSNGVIEGYRERARAREAAQSEAAQSSETNETAPAVEYEPEFDEEAYTPGYQANEAVLQDTPENEYSGCYHLSTSHAEKKHASDTSKVHPVGRVYDENGKLRSVFDFSACEDEKTLRKALSSTKTETLEYIARSFKEFQPRTDGKRMTKKFLLDAIVSIYFPKQQGNSTPAQVMTTTGQVEYEPLIDEDNYSPDYEVNLAVLDDIPTDHEPDTWKPTPVQEVKPQYITVTSPAYTVMTATIPAIMLGIGTVLYIVAMFCLAPLPLYYAALLCAMSALPYAVMGGTVPSRSRLIQAVNTDKPDTNPAPKYKEASTSNPEPDKTSEQDIQKLIVQEILAVDKETPDAEVLSYSLIEGKLKRHGLSALQIGMAFNGMTRGIDNVLQLIYDEDSQIIPETPGAYISDHFIIRDKEAFADIAGTINAPLEQVLNPKSR